MSVPFKVGLGLLVVAVGCGKEPTPEDTPPPDELCPTCLTAVMPAAPEIPCAMGFSRLNRLDDPGTCDPFGGIPAVQCDVADQAHFPGEDGCGSVSVECPDGDFPLDLPSDREVFFVQPSRLVGDGSRESPFGNLQTAIAEAPAGSALALARGTYDGPFRIRRDLMLLGACAAETVLTSNDASVSVVTIGAGSVEMSNMMVSSEQTSAIGVFNASATLRGIVVDGARGFGVHADTGQLDLENVIVRNLTPRVGSASEGGRAIWTYASDAVVRRVYIERASDIGVIATDGGTVELDQLAIRDTRPSLSGEFGRGVQVQYGATVIMAHSVVEQSRETGVAVMGQGSRLVVTDSVIRDSMGTPSGEYGRGAIAQGGAVLEMSRVTVERTLETAISLYGSDVVVEDVVVRDTSPRLTDERTGRAFHVDQGTQLTARRLHLARNVETGIAVMAAGTHVDLEDVSAIDTAGQLADNMFGRGVSVQSGASVTASRLYLDGNRESAAFVGGRDASLSANNVTAIRSLPSDGCDQGCASATFGMGISALDGGAIDLADFVVNQSELCGVFLHAQSSVGLARGEVSDNPVGACLQDTPIVDATVIGAQDVRWVRNGADLAEVMVPLPETLGALQGM